MAKEKYFTTRSTHNKGITFNVDMRTDKRTKPDPKYIEIKCQFPRPNPALMRPGVSYLSEVEKIALEQEDVFNHYVKEGKFIVHEVPFKDLPPEIQKGYDVKQFKTLQAEAAKAEK